MLASRQCPHCKTCGIVICGSGPYLDRFGIQQKKKEKEKEKEKGNQKSKRKIVCVFRAEEIWRLHLPAHRRSWLGKHAGKEKKK
ncbi:hypothetical protein HBH64_017640 [Parastagonospora nodorum]|nr:hypothetical protein HBH53_170160 [Parastagonospora nodorum]KAH4073140.1 hypothetical protein HBH50_050350 [Parastagonospora nodorum]KAH4099804.1 hypothetical protein HBH48_011810 [Parastagonospora nodorum]KAH4111189.1 hypothetical protein HBH46_011360 [Parastagonospora nodorum]KAH4298921.1 hypothetical protein HBI01_126740 [Parastagonospora nodorum]